MLDDLHRAIFQIKPLQDRIGAWRQTKPWTVEIDFDMQPGEKVYRLTHIEPPDILAGIFGGCVMPVTVAGGCAMRLATRGPSLAIHGQP